MSNNNLKKLLSIFSFILVSLVLNAETVTIVTSNWEPFAGENLKDNGICFAIVKQAYKKAGYNVKTEIVPWARALSGTKKGTYDVLITVWYTAERAQDFTFSEPYMYNKVKFISLKEKKVPYEKLEDLKGLRIGTLTDFAYDEAFMAADYLTKENTRTLCSNLKKLLENRIDLTLDDEMVARYNINMNFNKKDAAKFIFLDKPLSEKALYIVAGKENPRHEKLINDFNEQLVLMKKSGQYRKLLKKYGFK